ncbi:MAG: hypothetical protein ABH891_08645 [Candidatus Omnitrophota bacterium]
MNDRMKKKHSHTTIARKAAALAALKAIQAASVRKGLDKMTMDEIDAEIQEVRRERRCL